MLYFLAMVFLSYKLIVKDSKVWLWIQINMMIRVWVIGCWWHFFLLDEVLTLYEIFDSLGGGEKSVPLHLSEYISDLRVDVNYSNIRLQAFTSNFCGIFCINRLLSILIDEKHTRFMKYFNLKFVERNDRKLVSLISEYIKKING